MSDELNWQAAAVEIVTRSYAVTGRCRGLSEHVRLVDLLNVPATTHLQLADAKVREFGGRQDTVSTEGLFLIDRDCVIFGRSLESPEEEARRRETRRIDFVEKAKHRMLVFAPPFRIVGDLHVMRGADLSIALPRQFEGFLAITDACITHESEGGINWECGFIAVNGRCIDMVWPSAPPGWSWPQAHPAETGEGSDPATDEASERKESAA